MQSIEIKVTRRGDTHNARTGVGASAKSASSTNSAYWAAHAVAEKVFGADSVAAVIVDKGGGDQHGTLFYGYGKANATTSKQAQSGAAKAGRNRNTPRPRAARK